eukprot:3098182-Heterocapsa_arctica.AAC.1
MYMFGSSVCACAPSRQPGAGPGWACARSAQLRARSAAAARERGDSACAGTPACARKRDWAAGCRRLAPA